MATSSDTRIGDYQLVDFLGAGGMGEVYRAVHTKLGRVAAIKILTAHLGAPQHCQRFLSEARILSQLQHPNIAVLYDFVEHGGRPCLIMEFVPGESLEDRIRREGRLPVGEALRIFEAVVAAVAYVHDRGIVHRDLKPSNVRLTPDGTAKLLDFGIAAIPEAPWLTAVGHFVGTVQYAAPEQLRGAPPDARTDVWALGILLYELLTGEPPFTAPAVGELVDRITRGTYTAMRILRPEVPPALEAVVARCLVPQPAGRWASARALESAFRPATLANPDQHATAQWIRAVAAGTRNRYGLAASAVGVLVVAAAFLLWGPTERRSVPPTATPQPASAGAEGVEPAPSSNPAASRGVPEGAAAHAARQASVTIESLSGPADVFVNGHPAGSTPWRSHQPVGTQLQVRLRRRGYEDREAVISIYDHGNDYAFVLEKAH